MTYKKPIIAIVLSLVITSIISFPVKAANVVTGNTGLTFSITAGYFTLTIDTTSAFQPVAVSSNTQTTYTGTALGNDAGDIAVEVDDARGATPANVPGWSVTANVSKLTHAVDNTVTIPVTNFSKNFSTVTVAPGSSLDGITTGTDTVLADANTDGISDDFSVLVASTLKGQGNFQLKMGYDLIVNPNQPAGDYTGQVVVTKI